ncbi:MAG: iron ABC transporter permease [Aminobacterium sp.]|jgi:iron complex transport system permease protein|nr:iron ABC transporter permease [Aminobacterium sp.]MDD4228254.1 iron ABC transporter permease [Aminobacterium sp.]MDD4551291.1 iron ABC transporter permease [Aminobacterium sp.]
MKRSSFVSIFFLSVFFTGCIVAILSLSLGSVSIPLRDVIRILLGDGGVENGWKIILFELRLPRICTSLVAGGALSVAGLGMQTLFQNPLAGPFVLGINAGASLGVALATLLAGSLASLGLATSSWLGSTVVLIVMMGVAGKVKNNTTLLILGLMIGYGVSAFVNVLIHFSSPERIQQFIVWSFGSFSSVSWRQLLFLVPAACVGFCAMLFFAKQLNALLLGEAYASTMGVSVYRVRLALIVITSLLAGSVTAFCGPVAFLGVAVPHLCRQALKTGDHRILIPACALSGGVLALTADFVAHMPGSAMVLPLNAVTSLVGAPVVIWIVLRSRRGGNVS